MKKHVHIKTAVLMVIIMTLSACIGSPANPSSAPSTDGQFQIISINEGDIVSNEITQTKVFDQCESASSIKAEISFNEIASSETGEQLVLGGSLGGEYGLSAVAKVNIEGSIQKYYSSKQGQSFGHQESISIEIPPNTKQQYDITWTEYRRLGSVDYSENGQNNSIEYNYRQGIQLSSSSVTNLDCPGANVPAQNPPISEPQSPATQAPIPTLAPLYPLSNSGVADGNGLRLSATVVCLVNCGNPTFPDYDPLISVQYKLTNTSQQIIIIPQFGGDETYIALNNGDQLYVWTSIGWCDRDNYIDSQSIGPGETIKWEWGYKLKNNDCGGIGDMLPLPDSAKSFRIVFPAIGERFGGANWEGTIPR